MKRIITFLVLCLLLVSLCIPTCANGGSPKVVDNAGLLTDYEIATLESKANTLAYTYGIDVVIVTVNSLGSKSPTAYADDYFDYNGYGIGEDHSGVLFLLSMEQRDWAISTCGKGIDALTDYGQELLMEDVLAYLSQDQYYMGLNTFVTDLQEYFQAYADGDPIDYEMDAFDYAFYAFIALGIGAVVGAITILVMRSGMKTAVYQHGARDYVAPGTYQIRSQRDIFLYSHVTKVRRASESSGTHRSSSGRSHGGSSGKF